MTIPICERLSKPDAWSATFHGGGSFSASEEAAPFEAAALIRDLVEALEEARGWCSAGGTRVIDAALARAQEHP